MKIRPDGMRSGWSALPGWSGLALPLLVAALASFAIAASGTPSPALSATSTPTTSTSNETGKYVGPGGCAATSCHGSVKPRADTRIFQNEYSIWVVQDKHSRAYNALTSPVGERIGRILGIGKSEEAPKCLACHSLSVPDAARAKTFDLNDGVSCESCHGPASGWLGPHTTGG